MSPSTWLVSAMPAWGLELIPHPFGGHLSRPHPHECDVQHAVAHAPTANVQTNRPNGRRSVTQALRPLRGGPRSSDLGPRDCRRCLGPAAWAAGLLVVWAAIRFASPRALARVFSIPHVPSGITPAEVGLQAEDVTIKGPRGRRLRGWFVPAPATGPQPAALVLHGWTGSASLMLPFAKPLQAAGLHVLLLDARCHGRSDDDDFSSMPDFAADAEHALVWLRADPRVDCDRVALVGHSVGAGACLMVAARDPQVAAVVSIASMADPADYMGRAMRRRGVPGFVVWFVLKAIQRAVGQRFTEFAPLVTISRLRVPVLLMHGDADRVVPLADAEALHSAAPSGTDLLVIPDADHSAIDRFLTVAPAVTAFLQRALQPASELVAGTLPLHLAPGSPRR